MRTLRTNAAIVVCLLLAAAGGIGAMVALAPDARADERSQRCDVYDTFRAKDRPCIAVGFHSSPPGQVGSFTVDPAPGGANAFVPAAATFELTGEEAPGAVPMGAAALAKFVGAAPGTYTITIDPIPGLRTAPFMCSFGNAFDGTRLQVVPNGVPSGATYGSNSVTITVGFGDYVNCDFVGVRGEVNVTKAADPVDGTEFAFTAGSSGFVLAAGESDAAFAAGSGDSIDGSVTVTENVPAGWELASIDCVLGATRDPGEPNSATYDIDVASASVTASFASIYAESVDCAFDNRLEPRSGFLALATPVCIEDVVGEPAAAGLGVGSTVIGGDGLAYEIVTGAPFCSFNCADGFDVNCDGALGDTCSVELNLRVVNDVAACLGADAVPASIPAPAAVAVTSELAHTGSDDAIVEIALGLFAGGAAAMALSVHRRRTHG